MIKQAGAFIARHYGWLLVGVAVLTFTVCRIIGPPVSYFGFAVALSFIVAACILRRRELSAFFSRAWARIRGRTRAYRHDAEQASHADTHRETRVALGLMQEAATSPEMTDEQRIFLSSSAAGMRARVVYLLGLPNRTQEQEMELHTIERGLAQIEGRGPEAIPVVRPLFAAPTGGFLSAILNPRVLVALAVIAALWAVTGGGLVWALGHAHDLRTEINLLKDRLTSFSQALDHERAARAHDVANARASEAATRDLNTRLREETARRIARERRLANANRQILQGNPPDWPGLLDPASVQHDEPVPEPTPSPAPASAPGGGSPR